MPPVSQTSGHFALRLALRLAIGAALLAFLFARHADLAQVWQLIQKSSLPLLAFALFIAISGEIITAYKWRLLVRHIGGSLPILKAIYAAFVGMFYNNFFPGSVGGDIARVLIIAREAGGKARATASAFMQRNTGLAGLFIIGLPAAFLWPQHFTWPGATAPTNIPRWLADTRTWLIAAALGYAATNAILFSRAIYTQIWKLTNIEQGPKSTARELTNPGKPDLSPAHSQPQKSTSHLHSILRTLLQKLQRFHRELHGYSFWLPAPLIISGFTQLIDVFLVYTYSQALGLTVPFTTLMVVVPAVSLINLIPVTINGIGLRELTYTALLASAGLSPNQAIALSLMQFAIIITLAAIGGLLHALAPGPPAPHNS